MRGNKILDKVFTNMTALYGTPEILPHIGRFDHHAVKGTPHPDYKELGTSTTQRITCTAGQNEKDLFAGTLMNFNWGPIVPNPHMRKAV